MQSITAHFISVLKLNLTPSPTHTKYITFACHTYLYIHLLLACVLASRATGGCHVTLGRRHLITCFALSPHGVGHNNFSEFDLKMIEVFKHSNN